MTKAKLSSSHFPFQIRHPQKIRPAIVAHFPYPSDDLLVVGITSVGDALRTGEFFIQSWREAGLIHPSFAKRAVTTIDLRLIRRSLGKLGAADLTQFDRALRTWFGIT